VESAEDRHASLTADVADILSVWVNGRYIDSTPQRLAEERASFEVSIDIPLRAGKNELLLLVTAVGMIKGDWMINAPMSEERKGFRSPVLLDGVEVAGPWLSTTGSWGERVKLYEPGPATLAPWTNRYQTANPLRWYHCEFNLTTEQLADDRPWALEIGSLFKGTLWINGQGMGRYWQEPSNEDAHRDPWGFLFITDIGQPPQHYYHIPADWLHPGKNTLVVFEERWADPGNAQLVRRK
jgi:hypothetical protein